MTSTVKFWPALLCIMCAQLSTVPALAQNEHADHAGGENLGTVHFPISCSPEAQRQFDRAVAMLHSFYYPETIKAFNARGERPQHAKLPTLSRQLLAVGSPTKAIRSFPEGRGRAYRVPTLVLFDEVIIGWEAE